MCLIPVFAELYIEVSFTAVISPAPAATRAASTAAFVGIELGSSATEDDTLKKAAVPNVLFLSTPLTSNIASKLDETPEVKPLSVNPVNDGESPVCKPVSTSVLEPLIVALTVPCDGELM